MSESILILITIASFSLIGILIYIVVRDYKRVQLKRRAEQEARRVKLVSFIQHTKSEIIEAIQTGPDPKNPVKYYSFSSSEAWKKKNEPLYEVISKIPLEKIQLGEPGFVLVKKFFKTYRDAEAQRNSANEKFIQTNLLNRIPFLVT